MIFYVRPCQSIKTEAKKESCSEEIPFWCQHIGEPK